MLGFNALCGLALCDLGTVVVPPPTPSRGGGGNFAQGGGKRNLPCLDELDVFCKLEKRKPGQTIIECLREIDTPEEIAEAREVLVEARTDIEELRRQARKSKAVTAEYKALQTELAALRGFLEERAAEMARIREEDEDDDDFLTMIGML